MPNPPMHLLASGHTENTPLSTKVLLYWRTWPVEFFTTVKNSLSIG
jgi:hypothetical protein